MTHPRVYKPFLKNVSRSGKIRRGKCESAPSPGEHMPRGRGRAQASGQREVLEFPAGGIDDHEDDPLLTAQRELMEETGYSVEDGQIELLAHMYANPTGARTLIWWYLARNVCKTGEQKVDPVEVIENLFVTPKELLQLIHDGSFAVQGQIAAAYMALERLGYITVGV